MFRSGRHEPDFVWSTGIHIIDALNSFWGPLTLIDHFKCPLTKTALGNHRIANFKTRSGMFLHLTILPDCGEWRESFEFFADGYTMEVYDGSLPPWKVRLVKNMNIETDETGSKDEAPFVSNGSYGETEAFIDFVTGSKPLPFDILDVYESCMIAHSLQDLS